MEPPLANVQPVQGLHHITVVAGNVQANAAFYHHVLGQRLVKRTVNFDDPGTYHLYYGDGIGTPGTVITFFAWQGARKGVPGVGEATEIGYAIPVGSLSYWEERMVTYDIEAHPTVDAFGAPALELADPDGLSLRLVETDPVASIQHWAEGPITLEHAIQGFFGVALRLRHIEDTAAVLTDGLGYTFQGASQDRFRLCAGGTCGSFVDLIPDPSGQPGGFGAGSIHHLAFRTENDREQAAYQQLLRAGGLTVTPVQDRQYFASIYFREPGGVLFELATDPPGFTTDEPVGTLGSALKLPSWLESHRAQIEKRLPSFTLDLGTGAK